MPDRYLCKNFQAEHTISTQTWDGNVHFPPTRTQGPSQEDEAHANLKNE